MNNDKKENKRDLVLKSSSGIKLYIILAGILLTSVLMAAAYFNYSGGITNDSAGEKRSISGTIADTSDQNGEIHYAVNDFADGKAKFFTYKHQGTSISYFILKSSDGVIRAAFDACDVCWESGKGYTQQGNYMVCNNCGRRFISTMINVVSGGCNPSPLALKVKGSEIVLNAPDIAAGEKYFRGVKR